MKLLAIESAEGKTMMDSLSLRRFSAFDQHRADVASQLTAYRQMRELSLIEQARSLDGVELDEKSLWVDQGLIKSAHKGLQTPLRQAIEHAKERIERFQTDLKISEVQAQEESGVLWGTVMRPLDSIGVYVPGGRAHYVMSLLFAAVPARMAGVSEIVVASPPKKKLGTPWIDPLVLYAAKILDISKILLAGGPLALAALAFGSKGSPGVQKLFASGGARTIVGLHQLSGYVGVESVAAHSELAIVADSDSSIEIAAADIIASADRDPESLVVVFNDNEKWMRDLTEKLAILIGEVKDSYSRETVQACLEKNFYCFVTGSLEQSIEGVNRLSPGTVCLQIENATEVLKGIRAAGQVLLGSYTLPSAVDVVGGAAGLVPTLGASVFSSSLSPASFMRRYPYVEVSQEALERTHLESEKLAAEEGFHTRSIPYKARS